MIKSWDYHNLNIDYSSYTKSNVHPSDIDMFYLCDDNTLIIGEIKNERGKLKGKQRKLYEQIIDGWKYDGIALFIVHDKYVQHGDTKVDVPECNVKEYYYKCKWHTPKKEIKVKDVLNKYIKEDNKMEITSDRDEIIFRQEKDGKRFYSIGLSRKDQNGNYINGYMTAVFKKDVDIPNQTKIKIKDAWLGFNLKDKKTYPHIFINDFVIVEPKKEENPFEEFGNSIKTESDIGEQVYIDENDIPF